MTSFVSKKILVILISVLSAALNLHAAAAESPAKIASSITHIVIDPGHGGSDRGAVYGKAREAEIVLNVAQYLRDLLKTDNRFKSTMTRDTDRNLSLQERVDLAHTIKADLFVSLHANAAKDKRARGVEFYFQNHLPADEETLFLAATENQMLKNTAKTEDEPTMKNDVLSIVEDLKRQSRMQRSLKLSNKLLSAWEAEGNKPVGPNTIRQAPFFVVSQTKIPSVLIELGFLSNPQEADKLMLSDYQKKIAQRIYKGLINYHESNILSNPLTISSAE
jgi:N-acetylmuramoyl-L-alanine amidase